MDELKNEYLTLVPLSETAKNRYERLIEELQYADILLKTDWAKHLIEETAAEWQEYEERISEICAEVDRDILHTWGMEYKELEQQFLS